MTLTIPSPAELLAYSVLAAVLVPTIIDTYQAIGDAVRFLRTRKGA